MVLSPGNRRKLELLEKDAEVCLFKNVRKGTITIYGPEDNCIQMMNGIDRYLYSITLQPKFAGDNLL